MAIAPRCDPTHRLAVVKDGLIANRIGIVGRYDEGDQAPLWPLRALLERGFAPDETRLVEGDGTVETGFARAMARPEVAWPIAEAVFEPHGGERPCPIGPDAEIGTRLHQQLVKRELVIGAHPNLVTQLATEGEAADEGWIRAHFHGANGQKGKCLVRHVLRH